MVSRAERMHQQMRMVRIAGIVRVPVRVLARAVAKVTAGMAAVVMRALQAAVIPGTVAVVGRMRVPVPVEATTGAAATVVVAAGRRTPAPGVPLAAAAVGMPGAPVAVARSSFDR